MDIRPRLENLRGKETGARWQPVPHSYYSTKGLCCQYFFQDLHAFKANIFALPADFFGYLHEKFPDLRPSVNALLISLQSIDKIRLMKYNGYMRRKTPRQTTKK
jgi:hypothetical protein